MLAFTLSNLYSSEVSFINGVWFQPNIIDFKLNITKPIIGNVVLDPLPYFCVSFVALVLNCRTAPKFHYAMPFIAWMSAQQQYPQCEMMMFLLELVNLKFELQFVFGFCSWSHPWLCAEWGGVIASDLLRMPKKTAPMFYYDLPQESIFKMHSKPFNTQLILHCHYLLLFVFVLIALTQIVAYVTTRE